MSALVYIPLGLLIFEQTQSAVSSDDTLVDIFLWVLVASYAGLCVMIGLGFYKMINVMVGFPVNVGLLQAGIGFLPQHIEDTELQMRLETTFDKWFPPEVRRSGKFLITATRAAGLIQLVLSDATGTEQVNVACCRDNVTDFDPLFQKLMSMPAKQWPLFASIRDG